MLVLVFTLKVKMKCMYPSRTRYHRFITPPPPRPPLGRVQYSLTQNSKLTFDSPPRVTNKSRNPPPPVFLSTPASDALKAVELGVAGVLVSNHGARQLDTVPATVSTCRILQWKLQTKNTHGTVKHFMKSDVLFIPHVRFHIMDRHRDWSTWIVHTFQIVPFIMGY